MDELLMAEMVDIALGKRKSTTTYFSKLELDPVEIRWGCIRILEWLRAQSVAFRVRPLELNPSSPLDQACIRLVEAADFLKRIVQIRDNKLTFAEGISLEEAKAMMAYAKEHYNPPLFVRPRSGGGMMGSGFCTYCA